MNRTPKRGILVLAGAVGLVLLFWAWNRVSAIDVVLLHVSGVREARINLRLCLQRLVERGPPQVPPFTDSIPRRRPWVYKFCKNALLAPCYQQIA